MYAYFLKIATLWLMMLDNESLDVYLGVSGMITQTELPIVREQGRLGEYAVVYRIYREKQGGGFGDQVKHPYSWAVLVYVDTYLLGINSARGERREWANLDSAAQWLTSNGFSYWWTRNDIEPLS
jgi:hypothetical protein